MAKTADLFGGEIKSVPLTEALSERYLSYALSTIVSRSLPDVRDGLKPVHRRLLYAMHELGLKSDGGYKKCARVVGDVIGKYHPHGEVAVYDAMVRMAQDFSMRYPLVDGQGNFGSIDGDNAAAQRYTECKMTNVAEALLIGLRENAVDFRLTYDSSDTEPVVLPGAFPNLMANGTSGIAVGMATNIPPHNVGEICSALIHLIKHPNARVASLLEYVQGPDFPTGGEIVETRETIENAYTTGRGSLRLRARWEVEKLKGGTWQIVVHEIPYQVSKAKLIEQIASLMEEKKLPFLDDIHDESDTRVRLVLSPKSRNIEPEQLMAMLFQHSDLETRFGINMNVVDKNQIPRVMNLKEILLAYLEHQKEVLIRRKKYRLEHIENRLEILAGYLIVYLNLDAVIKIIRNEDEPKPKLMAKFKLTEVQAEAILNMRLRNLRKLEEMQIRQETDDLEKEQAAIKKLLKNEDLQWQAVSDIVKDIKDKFGDKHPNGKRRTMFGDAPSAVVIPIAQVEKEPVTVVCSAGGWIRCMKGHVTDASELKYKEGDAEKFVLPAQSTDKVTLFASNGKFYTLDIAKLPSGRGFGEPVRLSIEIPQEHDIVSLFIHDPARELLMIASDGRGFIVPESEVAAQTKNGKQIMNLPDTEKAVACVPAIGDMVAIVGQNRKMLVIEKSEVPTMNKGRGVTLQKYKDGRATDAQVFDKKAGLTWYKGDKPVTETNIMDWMGKRGHSGRMVPRGFPQSCKFKE